MKNLRQIQLVIKKLDYEKSGLLKDLTRLNLHIDKKISGLKRIISYQQEYAQEGKFELSRSVPVLSLNLDKFSGKIMDLIQHEEHEIEKLQASKINLINKLELLMNKHKVIVGFEQEAQKEINTQMEKMEQSYIDDLSVNKISREAEYD